MPTEAAQLSESAIWTATQTREQFLAVVWLRWRILVNGFRRKGGNGELIGRIILYPVLAGLAIGPSIAAFVLSYFSTSHHHLDRIALVLWGTFVMGQFLNIQLGQPGTTFDPTELIRFPLRVRDYVFIRLCFGLLSPANVVVTLMSASVALGIMSAAQPALWMYIILAMAIFAIANVLFSRMIFAWVDRWLATRRAREVFTGLIFAFSIGVQWANFTFNPAYNHGHSGITSQKVAFGLSIVNAVKPYLAWLPPQLTTSSLIAASHALTARYFAFTLACALYALAFFIVFALRMRTEFRGENLSDAASAVATSPKRVTAPKPSGAIAATHEREFFGLSPHLIGILGKEFLYIRRHTGILYGLIMPMIVMLFVATRFARMSNAAWVFPALVAYTMLAISNFSYNSFGLEGTGSQFYFIAPVRLRDVILAKNIASFLTAFVEILLIFAVISFVAGAPPVAVSLATLLWAAATLLLTTLVGNRRSIVAPKKVATGRMASKQVSQLSALISLGILTAAMVLGAIPAGIALYFHHLWIVLPVAVVYAAVAVFFYQRSLRSFDRYALDHREELFVELCKAG